MATDTPDEDGATSASPTDQSPASTPGERMRRAIREVRREGYKVAVIYAVVDATVALLLANLLVQVLEIPLIPAAVPLPRAVLAGLRRVGVRLAEPAVSGAVVVALVVGVVVFAAETWLRVRRPLVEQFEAANPAVQEALRTARDALQSGRQSRIATRLYEDVLERLQDTSSIGLLDLRRIAIPLALVIVLSLVSIQVAVVDISIAGLDVGGPGDGRQGGGASSTYGGLQDGSSILGEPEDVSAGEQDLETRISTGGPGSGNATDSPRAYDTSGFAGDGDVQSQQAGFSGTERIEDAELIREYNLKIRQDTNE